MRDPIAFTHLCTMMSLF